VTEADYNSRLADVRIQWNKAEAAIKLAENVNNKVVNPAIFELRYAGRRLMEAEEAKSVGDFDGACSKLADAHFDCCRAQHDAIDAATSKISQSLDSATKQMSPKTVIEIYPKFSDTYSKLHAVRQKISESRENRDCRDTVYDAIADVDLPELVRDYNEFKSCAPLMRRQALFERWTIIFAGIITLVVGVIGGLVLDAFKDDCVVCSQTSGNPASVIESPSTPHKLTYLITYGEFAP